MADYDVAVIGLTTPAPSAPLAACRLVISVKNQGLFDAVASGWARVYDAAGLQVFVCELYSDTLAPGATGPASATTLWTPPAEGSYTIHGYLSTPLDQVEPNNNLPPTTVTISGEPPVPPTPVEPHAPQHEEDGADEISIEGLPGRVADQQEPLAHAARHQAAGDDQLSVASLVGELATPQVPKAHGNAYHSPTMATAEQLALHNAATAVHSAAENLANRETSGPNLGLVPATQLALGSAFVPTGDRYLRQDRYFHAPVPYDLICIWDGTNPTPDGWQPVLVTPPLNLPFIYIGKVTPP